VDEGREGVQHPRQVRVNGGPVGGSTAIADHLHGIEERTVNRFSLKRPVIVAQRTGSCNSPLSVQV
jgi:hypothetical protein